VKNQVCKHVENKLLVDICFLLAIFLSYSSTLNVVIIIYFKCKWIFTWWLWYNNNTQDTNNTQHQHNTPRSNKIQHKNLYKQVGNIAILRMSMNFYVTEAQIKQI
jgi:Ca2+/Na+ antiporter